MPKKRRRTTDSEIRYLVVVPKRLEGLKHFQNGRVLVHNHVKPPHKGEPGDESGPNGFRFWSQQLTKTIEVCPCKWASHLPKHYRVNREKVSEASGALRKVVEQVGIECAQELLDYLKA
jgi:hypothetical protein